MERRYRFGTVKQLRAILIYVAAIVVLGALLAPWLFWGGHWLAQHWSVAEKLGQYPFHRYFNRAIMLVAFVGLFWVARALGVRRWADIGVRRQTGGWRDCGLGFGAGFISIGTLAALAVLFGGQTLKPDLSGEVIVKVIGKALATGLIVGVLEEIFFRGGAYGGMRRGMAVMPALLVSSFIFSIVHFLKPTPVANDYVVHAWSGFELLATCGQNSFNLPYFITLLLAGVVLGWAYEKTGAVWLPIGLHAGWVFGLQLNPRLFAGTDATVAWFGNSRLENSWLCVPLLAAFVVAAWRWKGTNWRGLR